MNSDIDFLKAMNNMKTTKMPEPLISEFITKTRVMPPGTPIPGPVDLRLTPHVIEWLDNVSPYSPIQHQAILKAAQIAATMASECIIGYWMKEQPTAIMYLSATQSLLEKWATKRLEPMIDSIGMREKIVEYADNVMGKKSRRTGDKVFSKQFVGGFLEMASAQSPSSQRSDSIRVMIRDEIDGAPTLLTTGEGNWLNTSAARLKFWGSRKKITDLSTPTTYDLSNIYPLYEEGDRRHRMVPCPHCGKMQPLDWLPETGTHGLRGETTAGILTDVFYLCQFCHEGIFDIEKYDMFNAGKWEPTSTSHDPTFRSYYINSLYSPPGTVSWKDYYSEWYNAKDDPDKMRGFTNLYGGMPYKETGTRPKLESIIELRGAYSSGTAPNEVLYVTGAADVQRGKVMYESFTDQELETEMARMKEEGKNLWVQSLPRIELEIVGHSQLYRTHSIEYKIFYGSVADPYGGAWQKLREWLEETGLQYTRVDGTKVNCNLVLIDSGYSTSTVYQFCEAYQGIFPSKGSNDLKKEFKTKGDEINASTFKRYSKTKIGETQNLITISTNFYKNKIYKNLQIKRVDEDEQRPGFMDFPYDYPEYYFKMLTNEEQSVSGTFTNSGRNEALDIMVGNLCAAELYLDILIQNRRELLVKNGMSRQMAANSFSYREIMNTLIAQRAGQIKQRA